jgi:hypothetical protein
MVLKSAFAIAVCSGFLALIVPAMADEYRPDEFLGLDLPKAVLSPKRLGPPTEFEPVPIEAKADRGDGAQARAAEEADRKIVVRTTRVTAGPVERPRATARANVPVQHRRGAARVKLAKRHGNPLDAQARDTRIQTWPCRSGGICNWQR